MKSEFPDLFRLGRSERLQLVEDLWDSLAQEGGEVPISTEKREELRRRKERFQEHSNSGRTWEQVKDRSRSSHS